MAAPSPPSRCWSCQRSLAEPPQTLGQGWGVGSGRGARTRGRSERTVPAAAPRTGAAVALGTNTNTLAVRKGKAGGWQEHKPTVQGQVQGLLGKK